MAYQSENLFFLSKLPNGPQRWGYITTENFATVCGANYFADALGRGVVPGDLIDVTIFTTTLPDGTLTGFRLYNLTSVNTVSASGATINLVTAGPNGYVNVLALGAKGDGVSDDASIFQAAFTMAAASGFPVVYVPHTPNGYAIGATLLQPQGVKLKGDNSWGLNLSRIKPMPGFTAPLLRTQNYGTQRLLYLGVEGICFDGSSTTLTAVEMNCQQSVFKDLTILNCYTYGLHIGGVGSSANQQALNNHITDCYLSGASASFYDGIFLDYHTADTTIDRVYVENCQEANIRSRAYNDMISNSHLYTANYGYYSEGSCDKGFSLNYIENQAIAGVYINGGASDDQTLNATITGNRFRNINTGGTSSGVINLAGSYMNSTYIQGNSVRRDSGTSYSTPYFAHLTGFTKPAADVISGNTYQPGLITTGQYN